MRAQGLAMLQELSSPPMNSPTRQELLLCENFARPKYQSLRPGKTARVGTEKV